VHSLKALCEAALSRDLTVDSAMKLLALASMHSADNLKAASIEYLREHLEEIEEANWVQLSAFDAKLSFLLIKGGSKKRRTE
jgi:hypothetical protein